MRRPAGMENLRDALFDSSLTYLASSDGGENMKAGSANPRVSPIELSVDDSASGITMSLSHNTKTDCKIAGVNNLTKRFPEVPMHE